MENWTKTNVNTTKENVLSIEDIYTKKALALCTREWDDLLVSQIIKALKSKVYMLAASSMSDEEKDDNLLDMLDFIDQDLLNHTKLVSVLNKFIRAEFRHVSESISKKEKTSEITKNEIIQTLQISDNEKVDKAQRLIENYKKIIKKEKDKIKESKKIIKFTEQMLDDNTSEIGISIAKDMIKDEEEEIKEAENLIREAQRKIDNATSILEVESHKESLIEKYSKKITSLFRLETERDLAMNSMVFIVGRIKTIVESKNVSIKRKKELVYKQTKLLDANFLSNSKEALDLLKEFAVLKCKEEIEKLEIENDKISLEEMRFAPPAMVSQQLHITYSKFRNKKKCTEFIIQMYDLIPFLLKSVSEEEDPIIFKTEYVLPILENLKIPEQFHKYFMKIVDMYRLEEKKQLFRLAKNDVYRRSQLMQANLHLEWALLACKWDKQQIKECEDFVNHIQVNVFTNLAKDKQLEKAKWKIAEENKKWNLDKTTSIVMRLHRKHSVNKTRNPFEKRIEEIREKEEKKKSIWSFQPIRLKEWKWIETENPHLTELIWRLDEFNINSKKVKEKLKLYVKCYFNHIKTMVSIDENASHKIFKWIEKQQREI